MSGFRVQGAPSQIQSNVVGAGLVSGDQLGDQLPGLLASLQESPEATKTSALYYEEGVGSFNQPSFQRSFGAMNINLPINQFGDSASFEINPDVFWKGPMILSCRFTVPFAYYGPTTYAPLGVPKSVVANFENVPLSMASWNANGSTQLHYLGKAASVTMRPRIFYSWGAAYANLRQVRMNMGGAMTYVLDHYANWVGVMASCAGLSQRACLMKMAGNATLIPDLPNELENGLFFETAEVGSVPGYAYDGSNVTVATAQAAFNAYGGTRPASAVTASASNINGSAMPGGLMEHWIAILKTPNTNFMSMFQYRRPVDSRLFSSNFMIDIFTNSNLDSFIDSGLGYQPQMPSVPASATELPAGGNASYVNMYLVASLQYHLWSPVTDGLYPSCMYRQFYLPAYAALVADTGNGWVDSSATSATYSFGIIGADRADSAAGAGASAATAVVDYRGANYINWRTIARSSGYQNAAGPDPNQPTAYFQRNNFPVPSYNTVMNVVRLANEQLGARQVLETRPDLAVYYPFQHFTTQVYFVNQITNAVTNVGTSFALSAAQSNQNFSNTVLGGYGYGGLTALQMRNLQTPIASNQVAINTAISIPVNPLTALYICVFREKDRMSLGYSTPFQYSPALFWNSLELQTFQLKYSSQILQKYEAFPEYLAQQLHERFEPLIVPFRGGCVRRSDLDPGRADYILNDPGFPGSWYNSYIYELCMVDQLPLRNEAFFQQTPSFRGELLDFTFTIKPYLKRPSPGDFDLRSNNFISGADIATGITPAAYASFVPTAAYARVLEKYAPWCFGIPGAACGEDSSSINWNLNNDNLTIVCVFAQNALWQLNPLFTKCVFARGA